MFPPEDHAAPEGVNTTLPREETTWERSFQELKEERIIVGNPQDVVDEIQRYRDEFGAEYMFFRSYYPGMDPYKTVECIRTFGEEVIPHFA